MQPPSFVRCGGQTAGEEVSFAFAQAVYVAQFFEDLSDFFSIEQTLASRQQVVELENPEQTGRGGSPFD